MPRYKTANGSVVERTEAYVACFGEGVYTRVEDDADLKEPCCGEATVRESDLDDED